MNQDNFDEIFERSDSDDATSEITSETTPLPFDPSIDESVLIEIREINDNQVVSEQENQNHFSDQYDIINPYTNSNVKIKSFLTPSQAARLPDGTESLPLGSGIISGLLGEGGMARVYKIWNKQLELFRAVKVIYPTESAELMERFETEIKISSKLHHPNIVETYVVGDWNGLPYIEMELVEGISLETLIENCKNIPPIVCIAIGIQVASALAYAHTEEFLIYGRTYKGIIHRDLKPGNIMIGKNGSVKLMDFGIARPSEVHLHTVSGYIVGTLPYLSPEQLAEAEVDHRSDIYSFGTILYEALTGEKTFPQHTITNLMRMKVLHSYRKINSFPIKVTPELIKVIERCLRYEKNKRFETSKELENTLKSIYDEMTIDTTMSAIKKYIDDPEHFDFQPLDTFTHKSTKPLFLIPVALVFLSLVWFILSNIAAKKNSAPSGTDLSAAISETNTDSTTQIRIDTIPLVNATPDTGFQTDQTDSSKQQPVKRTKSQTVRTVTTSRKNGRQSVPVTSSMTTTAIGALLKKYEKTDTVECADAASGTGAWNDVITLLRNVSSDNKHAARGKLLLALAYIELGKVSNAAEVLKSFSSNDAFYTFLEGRVASLQGQDKLALNKFEEAMTRPGTVRSTQQIRNDALYFAALTYDNRFNTTRSPQSRQQAMIAWNSLKKAYLSRPEHTRFKLANQKLSDF
ncbi:MAG: serine/threonine protein kinase [Chitinispirillaceae bacterium]|nr:serine/threonine protein kinase [Chitinispirillaceae bacterium]